VHSSTQNTDTLFFTLGWDQYRFDKKRVRTCYAKLAFLHLVGVAGQVVHFGAQNIDTLFFTLRWDRYRFDKKHTGISYAELVFLHPVGSMSHEVHSVESQP
jgi:hypothetical protein